MKNLSMYCLTLNPDHLDLIKKINYIPVGLGKNQFSSDWVRDNSGLNITQKNSSYGEYTFHYWMWKNNLDKIKNEWIGFCQYRKFWVKENIHKKVTNLSDLNEVILKQIPEDLLEYESIIGEPIFVNKFKFKKFVKRNFKKMILSPSLFFNKKKRNLKFHFDFWHGDGNLEKAIKHLDPNDRSDFTDFMNNNTSFNPHNMFICKSKEILEKYYENVFPWLSKCEDEFKTYDLTGYGMKRIYGFLAERYMSYWFQKNTKFKIFPIYFKDISDFI
ncbi:MAG: hypothetical protein CMI71_01020 [Candidatus Pelagibacter sp.]|nr:hypothetical protein [Candidatus Pelagibacter sp.]